MKCDYFDTYNGIRYCLDDQYNCKYASDTVQIELPFNKSTELVVCFIDDIIDGEVVRKKGGI